MLYYLRVISAQEESPCVRYSVSKWVKEWIKFCICHHIFIKKMPLPKHLTGDVFKKRNSQVNHRIARHSASCATPFLSSFFFFLNLFIYFWLCWVFVAVCGLSLAAARRSYTSLRCTSFSLQWLLLLHSTGSRRVSFSSCGTRAQ